MEKQNNIPFILFAKFFSGEISDDEQIMLDKFISEDPENEKVFNEYEFIWSADSKTDKFSAKTEIALKKVKSEIQSDKNAFKPNNFKIIYRIAAVIILVLTVTYFTNELTSEKEIKYTSIETKDQILKKELNDGSVVWLNKNSKLEYPEEFEKDKREVKLTGEAYFIISHNPDKPFIAETEFTKTEVLGTEFNLKANVKDEDIELVLVKGKVKFTDDKTNVAETLIKNEKVILNKQNRKIGKSKIESSNFLSWKTNEINLDNLSISQIAQDLSKYFDTEITADEEIKDILYHQTLPFTNPNLKDILNTIKFSLNLSIDSIDNKIVIKEN